MRNTARWRDLLGVNGTVVEDVQFDRENRELVVSVRPIKRARGGCGECGRTCPG